MKRTLNEKFHIGVIKGKFRISFVCDKPVFANDWFFRFADTENFCLSLELVPPEDDTKTLAREVETYNRVALGHVMPDGVIKNNVGEDFLRLTPSFGNKEYYVHRATAEKLFSDCDFFVDKTNPDSKVVYARDKTNELAGMLLIID